MSDNNCCKRFFGHSCKCRCSTAILPSIVLSRQELVLFITLLCGAIAGNGWLLYHNVERARESEAAPISQISHRDLAVMPPFHIVFEFWPRARYRLQCTEGTTDQRGRWKVSRACNREIAYGFLNLTYVIIKPTVVLRADYDTEFVATIAFSYDIGSTTRCFIVVVIDPANVHRFIHSNWNPPPNGQLRVCPEDMRPRSLSLQPSATEYPNNVKRYAFVLNPQVRTGLNSSTLFIWEDNAFFEADWNTLSVAFSWLDAASSCASMLAMTFSLLGLFFPFRAVAKYSIRCCWRSEGKGIDREYSLLQDYPSISSPSPGPGHMHGITVGAAGTSTNVV